MSVSRCIEMLDGFEEEALATIEEITVDLGLRRATIRCELGRELVTPDYGAFVHCSVVCRH
jgi:hypothetical protein